MEELKYEPLGKYIDVITDYHSNGSYESLKKNVTLLDQKDYAIIIRTLNFERDDFTDDLLYVDKSAFDFLAKSEVHPDDILMNKIANPGSVYIMPDLNYPVTCGMNLFLIRFDGRVNQRYMYYNMKNVEDYIKSFGHGTTTKTITKDDVKGISVYIHSKPAQDKIADLLTTIDRVIENNKKLTSNLEKAIKLIYNYWFVQFDFPDGTGRPYKSSGGSMIYDPRVHREIPQNWHVRSLKDVFEFERGIEVGSDNYYSEPTEKSSLFIRVSDMNSVSDIYTDTELLNGKFLSPEDICVSFDGTVGKVDYGLNGGYSTGIRKIYDKNNQINNAVIYAIFKSDYIQYVIEKFATGSNILHASEAINHMDLPFDDKIMEEYQKIITPLFDKMLDAKMQNDRLTRTKKWLLPMLMNGQIEVRV
jgi:type I restriction enzyme S subunit